MLSSATNFFTPNNPDQEKNVFFDIDLAVTLCLKIDFKSWK